MEPPTRDWSGRVLTVADSNDLGLYHKLHGVPRPVAMKKTVIKRRKRVPAVTSRGSAGPAGELDEPYPPVSQVVTESKVATTPVAKPKRGRKSAAASKTASAAPSPPESTFSRGGDIDMDVDAAEAERAAEEGVCRRPTPATSRHHLLTSSGHSQSQAAHQLAAETLLSIGPNSRSSATAAPVDRPASSASTSRVVEDSASKQLDNRGLKRKNIEDAVAQKARANAEDSPKRRAMSPDRTRESGDSQLPARGYHGPRPRPYSYYGSDEEHEFAKLTTDEQRHRRLMDWHHMRSQQKKAEDEMRMQEHIEMEKERMRGAGREREQRERDRRLGTAGLTNGSSIGVGSDVANSARGENRNSIPGAGYAGAGSGARPSPYRYGGSIFDNDRYGYGRPMDRTKDSTSALLSSNRPASWVNPLVASRSRPGSPTGSPAQSKASPTVNALTRKELQDHRDSLLEGKKWLEERLSKTERLLGQLNEKLAEPPIAAHAPASRPTSSHAPGPTTSVSGTPVSKEDEAVRARQARERELVNGRRAGYGGLGFGGGGLLGGGGGYGSPYGGGLGLLRMSEWDSWSRDKHLRERERENREKEAERLRQDIKDKAEREKTNGPTTGATAATNTTSSSTPTVASTASPSAMERKPVVAPLGTSSFALARRKELGGGLFGHGSSWSMT